MVPAAMGESASGRVCPKSVRLKGDFVSTPDHAENTGDNLRHAAELQEKARDGDDVTEVPPEQPAPLPDLNT